MSNLKKILAGTPKVVGKVCLKFPASAGRLCVKLATQPVCNCWETSNTLVQPLLGFYQEKFFWRVLTDANSKGFYYIGSCIRDILLHMSRAMLHRVENEWSQKVGGCCESCCVCDCNSAANDPSVLQSVFTITKKATTRTFSSCSQPGEGPSRGPLRDCTTSPINC